MRQGVLNRPDQLLIGRVDQGHEFADEVALLAPVEPGRSRFLLAIRSRRTRAACGLMSSHEHSIQKGKAAGRPWTHERISAVSRPRSRSVRAQASTAAARERIINRILLPRVLPSCCHWGDRR